MNSARIHTPGQAPFVGYLTDAVLMGALALPLLLLIHGLHLPFSWVAAETCSLLVISPHYLPTVLRLYATEETIAAHRLSARIAPVAIAVALIAACCRYTPFTLLFVTTYGAWRLYHYSAQTYGIASVYADRSDLAITPALRRSLAVLLFGSAYWYLFSHPDFFTAPLLMAWHIQLPHAWRLVLAAGLLAAAIHFAWHTGRWQWKNRTYRPPLFAIPVFTHLLFLFATPRSVPALSLAGVFHSTQYLFLSWTRAQSERREGLSGEETWVGRIQRSRYWLGGCLLGGIGLYTGLHLFAGLLRWVGTDPRYAGILPIMAINFHHFLADAVLWRRRVHPELQRLRESGNPLSLRAAGEAISTL